MHTLESNTLTQADEHTKWTEKILINSTLFKYRKHSHPWLVTYPLVYRGVLHRRGCSGGCPVCTSPLGYATKFKSTNWFCKKIFEIFNDKKTPTFTHVPITKFNFKSVFQFIFCLSILWYFYIYNKKLNRYQKRIM